MAKKVVASLKKEGSRKYAKVVRAIKTEAGTYSFKEEIVTEDMVQDTLAKKG